ncbi:MAG: M20/M25/M40 family metallo-hydrolase [Dehalococcoidia bacterium]|nr:M20/M25/M40 family metallo-hydrolase [Dehalococcoidia bacterium]
MERALKILRGLGSCPATPFFEELPAQYITEALRGVGVDYQLDDFGNIVAHVPSTAESSGPPVAFVAHMDHPGFEVVEIDGTGAVARAMGGVPAASLTKPVPVFVLAPDGTRIPGVTEPHEDTVDPNDRASDRLVRVRLDTLVDLEPPLPLVFDLADFKLDGDMIRMRAVDDLAGCAAILAALERVAANGSATDVYGVFTRAEEGGLFGARLMAEAATLPKETAIVSVESSSVIPGVAQGEGPVIRTGDALTTFDSEAESVLTAAVVSIRGREPEFKAQRQLMSGGVCEATAFSSAGYAVTGVAFPLGNYHNATTTIPDAEGGVAEEYIRVADYLGGVELLAEAAMQSGGHDGTLSRLGGVTDDVWERLRDSMGW